MTDERKKVLMYQSAIPNNLSENRYITGFPALNLPAPEGTSGDWHFLNTFYYKDKKNAGIVTIAGEGEILNTNHILGNYGVYRCADVMRWRGLKLEDVEYYAANHFRAILDLVYECLKEGHYPSYLDGASEDYLDTEEEKELLLEKATMIIPYLEQEERKLMHQWVEKERKPGYRS